MNQTHEEPATSQQHGNPSTSQPTAGVKRQGRPKLRARAKATTRRLYFTVSTAARQDADFLKAFYEAVLGRPVSHSLIIRQALGRLAGQARAIVENHDKQAAQAEAAKLLHNHNS